MNPKINWNDENDIRRVFSYQTKIGIAPKFGTLPIGWYQTAQCAANDLISKYENVVICNNSGCVKGLFEGKWHVIGTARELYGKAITKSCK